MKVAIYQRNSKAPKGWKPSSPNEEPPGSWMGQQRRLQAWAQMNGHEVVMDEHDVASGSNPNRPGWRKVMQAVKGGHVQAVAIVKTDRAMRSTKHYLEAVETFLERNVHLEVLDQPMAAVRGRGDPMAVAFRTVAAAFAQLERDLADERSNDVMELGEDGRLYGPRSERPAGRPREYGPDHKFRKRGEKLVHDAARCRACRGQTGGSVGQVSDTPETAGVAEPVGLTAPDRPEIGQEKGTVPVEELETPPAYQPEKEPGVGA